PAQLLLQQLAAALDVLLAGFLLEPLPDLGPGVVRGHERQPVAAGPGAGVAGDDLDDIAGVQVVRQGDEPAVDLRPDAAVTDVGVNAVGEVDRRGAGRQGDDVRLRGRRAA